MKKTSIYQSLQSKPPLVTTSFALWNLGFRPFYLLASFFGAFSILLWAAQLSGYLSSAYLQGPVWHGHEMLFGYTTAVITGFLLTAVRVWTKEPTPSGMTNTDTHSTAIVRLYPPLSVFIRGAVYAVREASTR